MRILVCGELFYLVESSTVFTGKLIDISAFILINQGGFFRPDYQARMIFTDGKEYVFSVSKQGWKRISRTMSRRGWQTVYTGLFLRRKGNTSAILNPHAVKFIGPVAGITLLAFSDFRYWEVSRKEFFRLKDLNLSAREDNTEEMITVFSIEEEQNVETKRS
jgi:hypothetical protein